jgi:hypothetical protein
MPMIFCKSPPTCRFWVWPQRLSPYCFHWWGRAPQTGVGYWGHELHRNHQSRGILPHTELLLGFLFSNVRSLKHPSVPALLKIFSFSV